VKLKEFTEGKVLSLFAHINDRVQLVDKLLGLRIPKPVIVRKLTEMMRKNLIYLSPEPGAYGLAPLGAIAVIQARSKSVETVVIPVREE
jgi:hypothetical protein